MTILAFVPNMKLLLTTAVITFAGLLYLVMKSKRKTKSAVDALNYLDIKIISSEDQVDDAVAEIQRRSSAYHAIGFDCEWVTDNGHRQPVALLQLSTYDGFCLLFRLNKLKLITGSLKELLEDDSLYKVGVTPGNDAKYLQHDYSVTLKSSLDIRHLVDFCGYDDGGLAALSASLLGVVLDKSWRVRCSDWEADELTTRQVNYAAADAHVAIKMFVNLVNGYYNKGILSYLRKSDSSHWDNINDLCWKYADMCYKTKQKSKRNENSTNKTEGKSPKVMSKRYPHATRSKPLYHNCFLQAPDGELLCTCDTKKAFWYIDKGLAEKISTDPLTVRLKFEPAGRSVGDVGKYYQLKKENKCVVCGQDNSYIRKNIVPREYRKYFPEIVKDRSSHDVLLLCGGCHQRSNMLDQRVRERLAELCDAPLVLLSKTKYTEDADCKKIRSAARALLYQSVKHALPERRRAELEAVLLQHYPDHDTITTELLQEAANVQVIYENTDYESHGHKVVNYYLQHSGILALEELWREHFLASMRPRYMPELWSVKHNEERLRIKLNEGRLSEQDMKLCGL
ncbi:exonuclease 3'-5' domain-containing protein 2 [Aricia agestis]|uniref:exonuclease 3'-5' domain-containing protein 2 n=1 Tax=Aricia agestis TaxID=91739 RepID=UPI001C203DBA|nr:exonuclease 3'-5' domain-containing protein 2 [Aricia agestis]